MADGRRPWLEAGAGLAVAAGLWWTAVAADPTRPLNLSAGAAAALWDEAVAGKEAEDAGRSLAAVERLLTAYPHEPRYLEFEAEDLERLSRPRDAARAWELYMKSAPFPTEACPKLGRDYTKAGLPDLALDAHRRCLESDPSKIDLMVFYANALMGAGRDQEAETRLREARRRAPDDLDPQVALARLALKRHDAAGARALLAPALAADPGDTDALVVDAQIALETRDYGRARASLLKAAEASPRYEDMLRLLLRAQNGLHDEQGAAKTRATLAEIAAAEKGR